MSAYIDFSQLSSEDDNTKSIGHLMPCEIHHNGRAEVSKFFGPVIRKNNENENILEASFRGRPLRGQVLQLPEEYTGVVLEKDISKEDEDSTAATAGKIRWSAKHKFDEFTAWNWDKEPSRNDKIQQALDWLDIAKAIHSVDPPSEEET